MNHRVNIKNEEKPGAKQKLRPTTASLHLSLLNNGKQVNEITPCVNLCALAY